MKLFRDRLGLRLPRQLGASRGQFQHRGRTAGSEPRTRGYDANLINKAIDKLEERRLARRRPRSVRGQPDVYNLLRYGVKVKPGVGEQTETVWLIDWENPTANHFAIAEEVTVLVATPSAPTSSSTSTASPWRRSS